MQVLCGLCGKPVGEPPYGESAVVYHMACSLEYVYGIQGRDVAVSQGYKAACKKREEQVRG